MARARSAFWSENAKKRLKQDGIFANTITVNIAFIIENYAADQITAEEFNELMIISNTKKP